jgi:para-nitrobenzyl esterase
MDLTTIRKRLFTSVVAGLAALAALVAGSTADAARPPGQVDGNAVVRTADGLVRGTVTGDHRIFQGIPYADPPVGDLRLRAPRPIAPWNGIRDATHRQAVCPQTFSFPPGSPIQFQGAEDCLYLNLHVPRGVTRPMPVMSLNDRLWPSVCVIVSPLVVPVESG